MNKELGKTKALIWNVNFDEDEIVEKFKVFVEEEYNKRMIKKGKLFSVCASRDSIDFGDIELLSSRTEIMAKDVLAGEKLYKKYQNTVRRCLEALCDSCVEHGCRLDKAPTGGLMSEYIIIRD